MIPQTDIHKVVGFLAGVVVSLAAHYGFNVPVEIAVIMLNGVFLVVSTWVGKHTNPTGANKSEARQVLEDVVKVETTATRRTP